MEATGARFTRYGLIRDNGSGNHFVPFCGKMV
jgi:hypothetical protein